MLVGSPAQIQQFDKMANKDQGDYVVLLIEGAQQVLIETGRRDLADKVPRLFTETPPSDDAPIGVTVFEINLAKGRLADLERLAKDPKAARLHVEHVMTVTLRTQLDITLPRTFMQVGNAFKPKFPLKK